MIYFATCAEHRSLTADDLLAVAELGTLGIKVLPLVWDEAGDVNKLVVMRSCWDSHHRGAEFRAWLGRQQNLMNPPETVAWNLDKSYLRELEQKGVDIPNTRWVRAGSGERLEPIFDEMDADELVVKPAVSILGENTWRARRGEREIEFEALISGRDVIVQEFLPEIQTEGEWSFVFFDRELSHVVRKIPRAGEFRVHEEHGGRRMLIDPGPKAVAQARAVLDHVPGELLYARIDMISTARGLLLMELEIGDPALFMSYDPGAPARFAAAIARSLK